MNEEIEDHALNTEVAVCKERYGPIQEFRNLAEFPENVQKADYNGELWGIYYEFGSLHAEFKDGTSEDLGTE